MIHWGSNDDSAMHLLCDTVESCDLAEPQVTDHHLSQLFCGPAVQGSHPLEPCRGRSPVNIHTVAALTDCMAVLPASEAPSSTGCV